MKPIPLVWLLLLAAAAHGAPGFKPHFEVAELDRARLSGDKHLIWFRLKTKVNITTLLDVCIGDSSTGESTCSSTITAKPEDSSQAVFVIAKLTGSTSLSIRHHNLRDEVVVARLTEVPEWNWLSVFGWLVAALLAGPVIFLWRRLQQLQRQAGQIQMQALLTPWRVEVEDLSGRYKGLNSDMVSISGRLNQVAQEAKTGVEAVKAIPPPCAPERAIETLESALIQPPALVASTPEDGLLAALWLVNSAWHSDDKMAVEAVPAFVNAQGFDTVLVDVYYVEGAYEFKSTEPSGRWMLSAIPGSQDKFLSLLARRPSKGFERLKELVGVEATGEVAEMERPCRLTPSPLVNRYVVKTPGYARMKGAADESAEAKLGKRINAVLQLSVARPAAGVPAQFKEVQEAAIRATAFLKGLEHRVSGVEQRLSVAPPPAQQAMAAAAGAGFGSARPVVEAPPLKVESEPVARPRPASELFPVLNANWWSEAVTNAASGGGSPEDYFRRVLLLRGKFEQLLVVRPDETSSLGTGAEAPRKLKLVPSMEPVPANLEFSAVVAWVRWDKDDQRFRVIRARTTDEDAFAQEPDRVERQLVGRELFQLLVGIEHKSRKGILLFVPAGVFSVDQHPTVLTRILEDPPEGPQEIRGIRFAAELARDKTSYILREGSKLILEYRSEEDDLAV